MPGVHRGVHHAGRPGTPDTYDPASMRVVAWMPGSNGRYWARTSDPQLVELVLSQLS